MYAFLPYTLPFLQILFSTPVIMIFLPEIPKGYMALEVLREYSSFFSRSFTLLL